MKVKCINCGSEWKTPNHLYESVNRCPFCGCVLDNKRDKMNNVLEDAFREIYLRGGRQVICSDYLLSYFSDITPTLRKYRILIKHLIEINGHVDLFKAAVLDNDNRNLQIDRIKNRLINEFFLDEAICSYLCMSFCNALHINNSDKKKTKYDHEKQKNSQVHTFASVNKTITEYLNNYGNYEELLDIGISYLNSSNHNNCTLGKQIVEYFAIKENGSAQCELGNYYSRIKDYSNAFVWYQRAISNHSIDALFYISIMYGMAGDYQSAARYCAIAAENNHLQAQYEYGLLLEKGIGIIRNRSAALQWYKKAAKRGHEEAQIRFCKLSKQ